MPVRHFKRSASLVRGRFWKAAITYSFYQIVAIGAIVAGSALEVSDSNSLLFVVVGNMIMIAFQPLPQIAAVLLYYDARVMTEDYDITPVLLDVAASHA